MRANGCPKYCHPRERTKTIPPKCSFSVLPFKNKSFSEAPQDSFHSYHKYQLVHLYGPSITPVIHRAVDTGNNFSFLVMVFGSVFLTVQFHT